MNIKNELLSRLQNRSSVIGIIGLGYVGLPLALRYTDAGFRVLGLDIDPLKPQQINAGESYFEHISSVRVQDAVQKGLEATTDYSRAVEADALIICVPTPLRGRREPDLSFVINTMEALLSHLRPGQVISLESTTYPGTTEEELRPRLELSLIHI